MNKANREALVKETMKYAKRVYNTHTRFLASGEGRAVERYNAEMNKLSKKFSGKFDLTRQVADFNVISTGKKQYDTMSDAQLLDYNKTLKHINENSSIRSLREYRKILKLSDQRVKETAQEVLEMDNLNDEEIKSVYKYIDALRNSGLDIKPSSQYFEYALDILTAPDPSQRLQEIKDMYREGKNRSNELAKSTDTNADTQNYRRQKRGNPKRG